MSKSLYSLVSKRLNASLKFVHCLLTSSFKLNVVVKFRRGHRRTRASKCRFGKEISGIIQLLDGHATLDWQCYKRNLAEFCFETAAGISSWHNWRRGRVALFHNDRDRLCYTRILANFLPARRYASAGLCESNASVCLSVCHTRYCVKTKKASVMISSPW